MGHGVFPVISVGARVGLRHGPPPTQSQALGSVLSPEAPGTVGGGEGKVSRLLPLPGLSGCCSEHRGPAPPSAQRKRGCAVCMGAGGAGSVAPKPFVPSPISAEHPYRGAVFFLPGGHVGSRLWEGERGCPIPSPGSWSPAGIAFPGLCPLRGCALFAEGSRGLGEGRRWLPTPSTVNSFYVLVVPALGPPPASSSVCEIPSGGAPAEPSSPWRRGVASPGRGLHPGGPARRGAPCLQTRGGPWQRAHSPCAQLQCPEGASGLQALGCQLPPPHFLPGWASGVALTRASATPRPPEGCLLHPHSVTRFINFENPSA